MKKNYFNNYLSLLCLGLSSGINYGTLGSTITLYLYDYKISLIILGLLSLRTLPYSFKAISAPIIDILHIKIFPLNFGQRKSWLILMHIGLIFSYIGIGSVSLPEHVYIMCFLAFFTTILASIFDNTLEAYRIEVFNEEDLSYASAFLSFAFRLGLFLSSSIYLLTSSITSGKYSFYIFAAITALISIILVFFSKEGKKINTNIALKFSTIKQEYKNAFYSFFYKRNILLVLMISAFFKVSDSFLDALLIPFLQEVGFSKQEIVGFNQTLVFAAYILGTMIGGYILSKKYNKIKTLIVIEFLAAISNLGFFVFLYTQNKFLLSIISFFESFCSSLANISIMTFLCLFCKRSKTVYIATFYSILGSISLLSRNIFCSLSGIIAVYGGWKFYFIISTLFSIPSIICCIILLRKSDFDKN